MQLMHYTQTAPESGQPGAGFIDELARSLRRVAAQRAAKEVSRGLASLAFGERDVAYPVARAPSEAVLLALAVDVR